MRTGDDIHPRGTVEVKCSRCGFICWVDCLDPALPGGPFTCAPCADGAPVDPPSREMTAAQATATRGVLSEVLDERLRQHAKWGEQNYPDGTGKSGDVTRASGARRWCSEAFARGECTFRDVLAKEVAEAFAERDPAKLRAELVQVAAVAVQWVEAIDRHNPRAAP